MQCPCCQKNKRSNSQWPTRSSHGSDGQVHAVGLATCLQQLVDRVAEYPHVATLWDESMELWEHCMRHITTKKLSQYGALPRTSPWEPSHWTDPGHDEDGDAASTPRCFYDPHRDVYAYSIALLLPSASSTARYDADYLGVVVEAMLGWCWLFKQQVPIVTLLARTCKYVYRLKTLLNISSFDSENRLLLERFLATHSLEVFPKEQRDVARHANQVPGGAHSTPKLFVRPAWLAGHDFDNIDVLLEHVGTGEPGLASICNELCVDIAKSGATRAMHETTDSLQNVFTSHPTGESGISRKFVPDLSSDDETGQEAAQDAALLDEGTPLSARTLGCTRLGNSAKRRRHSAAALHGSPELLDVALRPSLKPACVSNCQTPAATSAVAEAHARHARATVLAAKAGCLSPDAGQHGEWLYKGGLALIVRAFAGFGIPERVSLSVRESDCYFNDFKETDKCNVFAQNFMTLCGKGEECNSCLGVLLTKLMHIRKRYRHVYAKLSHDEAVSCYMAFTEEVILTTELWDSPYRKTRIAASSREDRLFCLAVLIAIVAAPAWES